MEIMVEELEEFWRSKRVLITGHNGFKGSWLSLVLKKFRADVYGISLLPETKPNLNELLKKEQKLKIKEFLIDIRNFHKLSSKVKEIYPDIIFHLAAQPLVRKSYKNPLETWETNVLGTLNLLESLKKINKKCSVVIITTDKVYKNLNMHCGYREDDELGGYDPYSASKAACELAVSSWRDSFCGRNNELNNFLKISTARSGNVIGGGDWSEDRIVPDTIKAFKEKVPVSLRNPNYTRPWQHVLDPLSGYLELAKENYISNNPFCEAFNFGPRIESNTTVNELVKEIIKYWPGTISKIVETKSLHESELLHLQIDKSYKLLNWRPKWKFEESVKHAANWYKKFYDGKTAYNCTIDDINNFFEI